MNAHHELWPVYPHHDQEGFTLLELTVVVLLLSILLGFVLPAIRGGTLMESRAGTARKIVWAVKQLKFEALAQQVSHTLHLDLSEGRIWATKGSLPGGMTDDRNADPWFIPEGMRIESVHFPDQQDVRSGVVTIGFYPQGYSDRVIIRLTGENGDWTDILIETFLPFARILDEEDGAGFASRH